MCLAVPYTIIQINDNYTAKAVSNGVSVDVRLDLLEKPEIGDTILVHAGFAVQKLEKKEADELFSIWEEVRESEEKYL